MSAQSEVDLRHSSADEVCSVGLDAPCPHRLQFGLERDVRETMHFLGGGGGDESPFVDDRDQGMARRTGDDGVGDILGLQVLDTAVSERSEKGTACS